MMPQVPPPPPRPDTAIGARWVDATGEVPWRWWHALAVYFVGFLLLGSIVAVGVIAVGGGGELTVGTGLGLSGIVASAIADVVFGGVMIGWLRSRTPRWPRAVRLPGRLEVVRHLGIGFGVGLLLYPAIAIGVGTILMIAFRAFTGETVTLPEQLSPGLAPPGKILAIVFALAIAPVVEELFFRGILFRSLRRHGLWVAATVSSLVFGLVHYVGGPAPEALFLMSATAFTGVGLALVYEWRGLAASIGSHIAFNAIGLVLIFAVG